MIAAMVLIALAAVMWALCWASAGPEVSQRRKEKHVCYR